MKRVLDILKKLYTIFDKSQKRGFIILCTGTILCALFETLGVSAIIPVINALMEPSKLLENELFGFVFAYFGIQENNDIVSFVIASTVLIYLLKDLFFCFFSWWRVRFSSRVEREMNLYMIKSYMNRGFQFFLEHNTNYFTQGISDDVFKVFQIINCMITVFTKVLTICFIGVLLLLADWKMAILVGCLSLSCLLLLTLIFRRRMKKIGVLEREYNRKYGQVILQIIQGIKEIMVMRKQNSMIEYYDGYRKESQKYYIKRQVGTEIPNFLIEGLFVMVFLGYLGLQIGEGGGNSVIALLATFAVGAFRIMPSLGNISANINVMSANLPSLAAVYENLIEAREFNKNYYNVDMVDDEELTYRDFEQKIELKSITFSYASASPNILDNLNLTISKGSSVGIIGASGAGKSTLADIILGLLDPTKGEVLVDDISIRRIPNRWSQLICFVPQAIYLADISIRENVAFGVPEHKIDNERVKDALARAKVLDFVETLPDGINTEIGERGVRISGGQRQRIGIARALYTNPQILVLDEATSALDNDTENSVMEDIELLQGNITLIIIAHRLTTIRKCDVIYEIRDGKAILRDKDELF